MSKFIGRKLNIGIGKEASTARGTAVAISFWTPKMDVAIDERIDYVTNDSSLGTIHDAENQEITSKFSEGEITGRLNDTAFGLFALATLGTEDSHAAVGGETLVFDHVFSVAESAQHPSLTIGVSEPNALTSAGRAYTLGMIDTLNLDIEIGKYVTYKATFRANKSATASVTPSYVDENTFKPQDGVVKFASALAGLAAASAIQVKKVVLNIKKNIEDDKVIGSVDPVDRLNKQFSIDGTVELLYNDRTYIDTDLLGDLAQAMRIQVVNTGKTIGSTSNPQITIDLAKVKLQEVARSIKNNELVAQTLKFKAFYSITDTKMIAMTIRNLQSAAY